MSKIVGMSRNINTEYLNEVARLYISGKTEIEIKEELNEYLSIDIKSPTNVRKTREILLNIWVKETDAMANAKQLAMAQFKTDKPENKLLSNWCLINFAFPVFSDVCRVIGKMDNNFDTISTKNIKNRMIEIWGERPTLIFSIGKIIKTLKDIEVLKPGVKPSYEVNKYEINDRDSLILIAETILFLKDKLYVSIEELNSSSEFFPFDYSITLALLQESGLFSIDKFGGELVISKKQ